MSSENAASRLASRYVGDSRIMDMLLRVASRDRELSICSPPSPDATLTLTKQGGSKKAVAIASALTDPAVIDTLARKDSRLGVRRALAENAYTSQETREYLFTWACRTRDDSTSRLWDSIPLRRAIDIARSEALFTFRSHTDLRSETVDLGLYRYVMKQSDFKKLAVCAASRLIESGEPAAEILGTIDPQWVIEVFEMLWDSENFVLTGPLAERMVIAMKGEWYKALPQRCTVTEEARHVLLNSGIEAMMRSAVMGENVPASIKSAAIATGVESVLQQLCSTPLSFDEVSALLDAAEKIPERTAGYRNARETPVAATAELLNSVKDLPSDLRLRILRRHDCAVTQSWVCLKGHGVNDIDALPNRPRPGELTELFASPGYALCDRSEDVPTSPEEVASQVAMFMQRIPRSLLTYDWVKEAYECAPRQVALWSNRSKYDHHNAEDDYLLERFDAAFGSEPILWETMLSLAPTWQGRLEELISTVFVSCGVSPKKEEPQPVVESDNGQLVMAFG